MVLLISSSFQPVVLYSTERQSFWKRGYPLLARLLLFAVVVEACDGSGSTFRCRLASHGVQLAHEGMLLGQDATILVQVRKGCVPRILPESDALVPDELRGTDRLVNRGVLPGRAFELEL